MAPYLLCSLALASRYICASSRTSATASLWRQSSRCPASWPIDAVACSSRLASMHQMPSFRLGTENPLVSTCAQLVDPLHAVYWAHDAVVNSNMNPLAHTTAGGRAA
eukprot:scaffold142013_cov31-Tisochrysis_lutea.AAC.9